MSGYRRLVIKWNGVEKTAEKFADKKSLANGDIPGFFQESHVIQELKQKDFHNVLIDVDSPGKLLRFFRRCHEVGFYGDGRNFFVSSLNFREVKTGNREQTNFRGGEGGAGEGDGTEDFRERERSMDFKSFAYFRIMEQNHPTTKELAQRIYRSM